VHHCHCYHYIPFHTNSHDFCSMYATFYIYYDSHNQSSNEAFVSDIAIFVLKRDVKLQLTNSNEACKLQLECRCQHLTVFHASPLLFSSGGLLDNSWIRQLADCQLTDWSTRGLDHSRTGQVTDWTTRGCHWRLCMLSFRSFGGICETSSCPVHDFYSPGVD